MRSGDIAGAWSPDSKWLAYSKVLPNDLSAIHLYSLADAKVHADDRWHERRRQPGVRQGRQVSVLHRQHQLRRKPGTGYSRRGGAPRPARFTWPCWTRRSPRRSRPKATRRRSRPTQKKPDEATPKPDDAAKPKPGPGRQNRSGRHRSANPFRAHAAAALRGASGGQGGDAACAGSASSPEMARPMDSPDLPG